VIAIGLDDQRYALGDWRSGNPRRWSGHATFAIIVPPEVHGVLDYPLAAIIIAGPIVFDCDPTAATVSARVRRRCRRARGGHGVADWDRAG
jgi:hypothetical protein